MASSSMPPPPSPLAHRRSRNTKPTSSLPCTTQSSSSCASRKMSLPKAATFHHSSSPAQGDDPVLSVPHLTRRSPTCPRSILSSWLSEKKDIAAQRIADFEDTFSGARGSRPVTRRRSAQEFELKVHRAASPVDSGLGSSNGSPSEKSLIKTLERALELVSDKDSALGDSIVDLNSEEDGLAVKDLIQEADSLDNTTPQTRQSGSRLPSSSSYRTRSSFTPAISSPSTTLSTTQPALSNFARRKISQNLLKPLLQEDRFKDFRKLVTSVGSRSNKNIRCLRDIEQSLIFQPLTHTVSQTLYRAFGELTVQLVIDTFQHLSESEQRRASDRPYDNGYFLDLVQQVTRLASHIGSSSRTEEQDETVDESAPSVDDEITLEGGLGETGEIAELVRWRNGKGVSLRTGLPYEATPGIKRESSTMLDEDIARSMARRKKGYIPEIVEMKCGDVECDKVFTRKCDLAKHEKTHSRPFKCPIAKCKYHDLGLPTEKERDRHLNDKHDPNPKMYTCRFCEFKTKRESNCKQHMEKKHGWNYRRAKGKDKDSSNTPGQTPQTPSLDFSPSIQSPAHSHLTWEDHSSVAGSLAGSTKVTPLENPYESFDNLHSPTGYPAPLFPREPSRSYQTNSFNFAAPLTTNFNHNQGLVSPAQTNSASLQMKMTPQTPAYSTITSSYGPSPYMNTMDVNLHPNQTFYNDGLPTPESGYHSRHASVSHEQTMFEHNFDDSPMLTDMNLPSNDFTMFGGAFSNPAGADATLFPAHGDYAMNDFTEDMFDIAGLDQLEPYDDTHFDDFVDMPQ